MVNTLPAEQLINKRIEIPIHFDMWMRGARYGWVTSINRRGRYIRVKMDHPHVSRRVHIPFMDLAYIKVIDPPTCM